MFGSANFPLLRGSQKKVLSHMLFQTSHEKHGETPPISSPSSSSPPPPWDVFLSFYGKDTRCQFTAHLYHALTQAAIQTFMDDPELRMGEHISSEILRAIKDSKASIVVLSQNYARSAWCLDELLKILAYKKSKGVLVFPVFYRVHPSEVRYQKGSFGKALEIHKKRFSLDKVDKWRDALTQITALSGYHVVTNANMNESNIIQQLVEDIALRVSSKAVHIDGHLVRINSSVEELHEKLRMQSYDVHAIGICGMGGIGKTTLAKAFYNKFYHKFQVSCFVENVKEISRGPNSLVSLLQQLLVQLLGVRDYKVTNVENGKRRLKEVLASKKVLLVLDNYGQSSYLDMLVSNCNLFAPGSRIIITTRDENLLNRLRIEIYKAEKWCEQESLELFSHYAFERPSEDIMKENFSELSKGFVDYVDGLPLALRVLGSSLRGRTVSFWRSKLEKIKRIPEKDIQEVLKMSYDELSDRTEKDVFLDIVFFFVGKDKDEVFDVFTSCDFHPNIAITILVERHLLTIDWDKKFRMHNLILDMGKEVIREESKMSGKGRRLLCQGNEFASLEYQEGTERIEGLIIDLTMSTEVHLSAKIFQRMSSLRLLEIINAPHDIEGSFENSLQQLRCIRWRNCPWKNLPSSFRPKELVYLDLQFSKFTTLWEGPTPLVNLKTMDVRWSNMLKTTSDLSNVIKLKKIRLTGCGSLGKVNKSIVQLCELTHLDLSHCLNLNQLPKKLGDMKDLRRLDASYTAIERLPDSISQLRKLKSLKLVGCKKLTKLPEQLGNMEGLRMFDASESSILQLPDSFVDLINLVELKLSNCQRLRNLPNRIWKLSSLQVLDLNYCSYLERLPEQLGKLQCLEELHTAVEELPDIVQLSRLKILNLSGCKKLKDVSGDIWNLTSLRCMEVGESCSSTKQLRLSKLSSPEHLPRTFFPGLPLNLRELVMNYESVDQLPDLSCLKKLETLLIRKCINLQSLPLLPPSLCGLTINNCTSLQDTLDMTTLKCLQYLEIINSRKLKFYMGKSFLKGRPSLNFKARLQTKDIPDWFGNKRTGSTVSCYVPPRVNFIGMALWVVYDCKSSEDNHFGAVVTNKTDGSKQKLPDFQRTHTLYPGPVGSAILCMNEGKMKLKSGDRIQVSFEDTNVQKCGVHFVHKPISSL